MHSRRVLARPLQRCCRARHGPRHWKRHGLYRVIRSGRRAPPPRRLSAGHRRRERRDACQRGWGGFRARCANATGAKPREKLSASADERSLRREQARRLASRRDRRRGKHDSGLVAKTWRRASSGRASAMRDRYSADNALRTGLRRLLMMYDESSTVSSPYAILSRTHTQHTQTEADLRHLRSQTRETPLGRLLVKCRLSAGGIGARFRHAHENADGRDKPGHHAIRLCCRLRGELKVP